MSDEKDVNKLKSSYERTGAEDLFTAKRKGNVHNISSSVDWILKRFRNLNNMPGAYRDIIDRKLGLLHSLVFVDGIKIDDDRKKIRITGSKQVLNLKNPAESWKQLSKVLRLASGSSQDDIAKLLGVSRQTFNQYENDGYIGQRFTVDQLADLEENISNGLLENNFNPQYGQLVFAIFPLKVPTSKEDITPTKYSQYVKSKSPQADFIDQDGTAWEVKLNRGAKKDAQLNWNIVEGTEGTMEQWAFLVDTMSKVYGSMQNQTKAEQKKTTEAIASASAKAIPDKFKDDIDSMSATALSGQYKRSYL